MTRIAIHPGEILREDYLSPLGMSASALARELDVPTNRVTSILNGDRGVTADTALQLGRYFDTTPEFWINLQSNHDLSKARTGDRRPDHRSGAASCAGRQGVMATRP